MTREPWSLGGFAARASLPVNDSTDSGCRARAPDTADCPIPVLADSVSSCLAGGWALYTALPSFAISTRMAAKGRQRPVGPRRSSRSIGPGRCLAPVLAHQPPAASTVIGYVSSALGTGHWRRSHLRA